MISIGPDGERLIAIGELVGAHGVRGEARVRPFNRDSSVLSDVSEVFLLCGESAARHRRLERARPHGAVWLVALEGVSTPEEVRSLVRARVAIRECELPRLEAGQFYCYQLIGLEVVDEAGAAVGTVSDVLPTAANDILVVAAGEGERLIPMIDRVVAAVDLENRRIIIRPVEGLFD
jgi:16S rRNA processing protein RimM